jgi:membrane-bound serine protease (ClpP class)
MSLRGAAVAAAAALLPIIAAALPSPAAAQAEQKVPSIELRGDLSPAQADWIGHALGDAADAGAPFAIVRLDTPGGIDSAAEEIVDQIRSAPIPVVVYVYPGGAEVKDQGASIVDAGDVAAMAPGTTLESEGNGLGENTALKQGRIEMIASDQEKLLEELDGYEVSGPKSERLSTAGTEIDDQGMTIPFQLLEVLVDPNVVLLLLLIGILGLALEAFAPGTIIPAAVGAVALVLGLIGLLVFDAGSEASAISPALVIGVGATFALATVLAGRELRARRGPVPTRDRV